MNDSYDKEWGRADAGGFLCGRRRGRSLLMLRLALIQNHWVGLDGVIGMVGKKISIILFTRIVDSIFRRKFTSTNKHLL